MKKLTQQEFISMSREIHGNKFDYSKAEFKNVRSKIIVICPNHGEILIRVSNHIHMKQGCNALKIITNLLHHMLVLVQVLEQWLQLEYSLLIHLAYIWSQFTIYSS